MYRIVARLTCGPSPALRESNSAVRRSGLRAVTQPKCRHEPISLFATARSWLHFDNLEVRHRSPCCRITTGHGGLISGEGDRLSDIGIKVNRHTVDYVRDSFFVHEFVFVRLDTAGQATGNCAVSFLFRGLTESESGRNHQNRQHK